MEQPKSFKTRVTALSLSSLWIFFVVAGASVAYAALTFSGTSITGDSNSIIDATGTVMIGALSATGITIGRSGITATFPGTVTITGATTTLQNLVVSGNCVGCGIGNFTAGGDLSGSSTAQKVIGLQGQPISSTTPLTNQVLTWNGTFWTPTNVSSTGGISAINGLSNSTTSIVGAGTVTVSTSSPNIITITGTGSGAITINSLTTSTFQIQGTANQITVATSSPNIISLSLPQNIGTSSAPTFGGLILNGNATTTNLTITGLGTSGLNCLTVNAAGNVATTTCGSGSSQWTNPINPGAAAVTPPIAPNLALVLASGNVSAGAHRVLITFVTASGETAQGAVSGSVTADGSHQQLSVTGIPTGPAGVVGRNIYMLPVTSPSVGFANGSTYFLVSTTTCAGCVGGAATIADNTTTSFTINVADASLVNTIAPVNDSTAGVFTSISIEQGPNPVSTAIPGIKVYGNARGDGGRYITQTQGGNDPGLFTNGQITSNGVSADPVSYVNPTSWPTLIGGGNANSYMFGGHADGTGPVLLTWTDTGAPQILGGISSVPTYQIDMNGQYESYGTAANPGYFALSNSYANSPGGSAHNYWAKWQLMLNVAPLASGFHYDFIVNNTPLSKIAVPVISLQDTNDFVGFGQIYPVDRIDSRSGGAWLGGAVQLTGSTQGGCVQETDFAMDATNPNKVSSATYTFVAADAGGRFQVTGGTGWTPGSYGILSVSGGNAILDGIPAALGATGGTASVNRGRLVYVESSTDTLTICQSTSGVYGWVTH